MAGVEATVTTTSTSEQSVPISEEVDKWELAKVQTSDETLLFPVKLDLPISERYHLQDSFMWSLNCRATRLVAADGATKPQSLRYTILDEQEIDPFATRLCEDLDFPPKTDALVANAIRQQLLTLISVANVDSEIVAHEHKQNQEHQAMLDAAAIMDPHFDPLEQLNPRYWRPNATRISARRKRTMSSLDVSKVSGKVPLGGKDETPEPEPEIEEPAAAGDLVDPSNTEEVLRVAHLLEKSEEKRILLKIDIIINGVGYQDQLEWEVDNPVSTIEAFAKVTACDLALPRQFEVAIAHEIHRQVFFHRAMRAKRRIVDEITGTTAPHNLHFLLPITAESALRSLAITTSYQPYIRPVAAGLLPLPQRPQTTGPRPDWTPRNNLQRQSSQPGDLTSPPAKRRKLDEDSFATDEPFTAVATTTTTTTTVAATMEIDGDAM